MLSGQKIKVAAGIGLADMARKHPTIAALEARLGGLPVLPPSAQVFIADGQVDAPRGHVDFNDVAILDQCQGTADKGFGRHMQNTGAILGVFGERPQTSDL